MIRPDEVVNRMWSRNYIESNLVYPLEQGYYYTAQLDKEWVDRKLSHKIISNKYTVRIKTTVSDILVTNHDGKYWLTVFVDKKKGKK